MANCPKCGAHLKLTDWRPTCPHCGINLIYYGMEERLLEDADKAESEHAVFQKKLDRLKASFIGSPLTIIRIVLSLLPIGALMLPLANVSFWGPFFEKKVSVNAITIYNAVSALDFDALFKYIGSSFFGNTFLLYFISLVTILLSAVLILVSLIMLTMGCSKHGNPRNITLNSIMIVLATVSIVCFNFFSKDLAKFFPDVFSGSVGFGAYVFLGTLVALLVINIVIAKVGVKVKYTETFIGGIPSEEYFEYVKQGMSTHAIRKMMAEIDANNKVELAMKAKEEADKQAAEQARAEHLRHLMDIQQQQARQIKSQLEQEVIAEYDVRSAAAVAKAAEAAGASDAGHKTQLAAQAVDAAAKKAMEAAELAREATAAMESLKQFNEPGAETEEKETVSADKK